MQFGEQSLKRTVSFWAKGVSKPMINDFYVICPMVSQS